jgi:hypothetical protein
MKVLKLLFSLFLTVGLAACSTQSDSVLDAESKSASILADSLEACGLRVFEQEESTALATPLTELSSDNAVLIKGKYLFVAHKNKWSKKGLSNVTLSCLAGELAISSTLISAIREDSELQKKKAMAYARVGVDVSQDGTSLNLAKDQLTSKALPNISWNSQIAAYEVNLRNRFAAICSDPIKWPGDTYLCGDSYSFWDWVSYEGCSNGTFCTEKDGYSGTNNLKPSRPVYSAQIKAIDRAILIESSSDSSLVKMEKKLGIKFTPIGESLSQGWFYSNEGNLVMVIKAR